MRISIFFRNQTYNNYRSMAVGYEMVDIILIHLRPPSDVKAMNRCGAI